MEFEKGFKEKNNSPEKTKIEEKQISQNENFDDLTSIDLEKEKKELKNEDDKKITKIRSSIKAENPSLNKDPQQYLKNYLELRDRDIERIDLLKARDLPENYQKQFKTFNDKRLDNINIAVVPDDLWLKGSQPSESDAENNIVLIKQSYFENNNNSDEIAWMTHELAHCQVFLDTESLKDYQEDMKRFAFNDLYSEYPYPNNLVERITFTKQFQFLKDEGRSREDVVKMISNFYNDEDLDFFDKILDSIYK